MLAMSGRLIFYLAMQGISFPLVALTGAFYAKRYGLRRRIGARYITLAYIMLFGVMYLWPWVLELFGINGGLVSSRCFLLVLLPTALLSRPFHLTAWEGADFAAPALYLARAVGKVGCLVNGCCYGVPWEHGIFSHVQMTRAVPLPLYESIACVLIAAVTVRVAKSRGYHANGMAYGASLLLLGLSRYLIQLATPDIFNNQSVYAIVMVLLGLALVFRAWRLSMAQAA